MITKKSTVLKRARTVLAQPYSWAKGSFKRTARRSPSGFSYCAFGAINEVPGVRERTNLEARLLLDQTSASLHPQWAGMMGFNDDSSTKKKDVLAVFDEAIATALAEEKAGA